MKIAPPAEQRTLSTADTVCPEGHFDQSLALLSHIRDGAANPVELHGELGRGGMAVVFEATQRSLGRKVAVKMPHDVSSAQRVAGMVAEAMVTGQLEHPGIVPVHALDLSRDDRPRLVLKRIEGRSWAAMLADRPADALDDWLTGQLRVWLKVAEALAFAHARGILHRDIKPENVMVGAFGEVYLLDWGVAVAFGPDVDGRLPRLSAANACAGTPHYMAPEQAKGSVEQGPATDVFLMAATLYRLLAGRPPYQGRTALALQLAAVRGVIDPLPDTVDPRLAAICMGALAAAPSARPSTVSALAQAVEGWLAQRPALAMLADVERRIADLEAARARGVERAVIEASFESVRASLAAVRLPDDASVADLRGRAVRAMIEVALDHDDPAAARRLLSIPGAALTAESIADFEARTEALRAHLAARAQALDPRRGRRQRGLAIAGAAFVFTTLSIVAAIRGQIPDLVSVGVSNAVLGGAVLAYMLLRRERIGRTLPNRLAMIAVGCGGLGSAALDFWGVLSGTPAPVVYVQHLLLFVISGTVYVVGVEPRAWPGLLISIAIFGAALAWPSQIMWFTALMNLFLLGTVALVTLTGTHTDRLR